MTLELFILILAWLTVAVLLVFGGMFFRNPEKALSTTDHLRENLPLVMGGRYMFFAAMLAAALLYQDAKVLTVLFAGFGFMGVLDAYIYRDQKPWAHAAVGVAALLAASYFATSKYGSI